MSQEQASFYELVDATAGHSIVTSTGHTAGPWSPDAQHGGPPTALMVREAQRLDAGSRVVARATCSARCPCPGSR